MDRRGFIRGVAAGLLVAPLVTRAQTPKTVRRIGVLSYSTRPTPAELQETYAPLRDLGWVEGQNLTVERRYHCKKKSASSIHPIPHESAGTAD